MQDILIYFISDYKDKCFNLIILILFLMLGSSYLWSNPSPWLDFKRRDNQEHNTYASENERCKFYVHYMLILGLWT